VGERASNKGDCLQRTRLRAKTGILRRGGEQNVQIYSAAWKEGGALGARRRGFLLKGLASRTDSGNELFREGGWEGETVEKQGLKVVAESRKALRRKKSEGGDRGSPEKSNQEWGG